MKNSLCVAGIFFVISLLIFQPVIAQVSSLTPTDVKTLVALAADFDLLRMLGFVSIGVAVAAGLALYIYRHRRLMQYDALFGLLLTVSLAPMLFYVSTQFLGDHSHTCLSMSVAVDNVTKFDSDCATARESTANIIGLKTVWQLIFAGASEAFLSAGVTQFLMYFSMIFGSAIPYLCIRPLLKRLG